MNRNQSKDNITQDEPTIDPSQHHKIDKTQIKIKKYEDKVKRRNERAIIFDKLKEQISQFKSQINTSDQQEVNDVQLSSSISPKRQKLFSKG